MAKISEEIEELRAQINLLADRLQDMDKNSNEYVEQGKEYVQEKAKLAKLKMSEAGQQAHEYAKENPWHIAGVAAAIGVALGAILASKGSRRD